MERWDTRGAAAAGLAATGVVAGAMAWARRAEATRLHFPRILGTALGRDRRSTRTAGWTAFLATGALLPLVYRAAARRLDAPGGVALGAALGLAHGAVAAAGAALLAPLHPRPRHARLASAARPRPAGRDLALLVGVHVLYGAALGALARRR